MTNDPMSPIASRIRMYFKKKHAINIKFSKELH